MASIRTTQIGDILTIKKTAQCCSKVLSNHHALSPYGKTSNEDYILPVGTQLKVLDKGKPETKWRQSYVTVSYKDKEFDILASDLRKFCE